MNETRRELATYPAVWPFFLCLFVGHAWCGSLPTHALTFLRPPEGSTGVFVSGFSQDGSSAGLSGNTNGRYDPVVWDNQGRPTVLPLPVPGLGAIAYDFVGSNSVVAGQIEPDNSGIARPVLWKDGMPTKLSDLGRGGFASGGGGNGNVVTGSVVGGANGEVQYAAVWLDGQLSVLDALPGINNTSVTANSLGKYVGIWSELNDDDRFVYGAFIGVGSSAHILSFPELGHEEIRAYDINDRDDITGLFYVPGIPFVGHPYATSNGRAYELGLLPGMNDGRTFALNDEGTVVGFQIDPAGVEVAVVYDRGATVPIDMNTLIDPIPGVKLVRGIDINNAGQILVEGAGANGYSYYILSPIPEPAVAGLVVFAGFVMRCRH